MKNKIIVLVISIIITLTSFMFILYIERKLLNPNGTTSIYVVKAKEIEKGQVVNEKNIDSLFKVEERKNEELVDGYIVKKEDLLGTTVQNTMYKNEVIINKKLKKTDEELDNIEDRREITINCADFSDAAGGSLREGDKVDIFLTIAGNTKVTTSSIIKNAYVSGALASDGSEVTRDNKGKIASSIKFLVSARDAGEIDNASQTGKLKLVKVVDDTDYADFKIENDRN